MKLQHDVTFDSLEAVRQEIREWFGADVPSRATHRSNNATRDVLLSLIIASLADELSDANTRTRILEALEKLPAPAAARHQ